MTRSNRIANRIILMLIGLVSLGLAAAAALPFAATLGVELPWGQAELALPDLTQPVVLWSIVGFAAAVLAFAILWIVTRGRGRTGTALRVEGAAIDATAVQAVLRDRLASAPDVVTVSASAHERRGEPVVLVRVQARSAPDLGALRSAVRSAVDRLDEVVGARIPVVVHVTSGVRSTLAGTKTTH